MRPERQARPLAELVEAVPEPADAECAPAMVQEDLRGLGCAAGSPRGKDRASVVQVRGDRLACRSPEQPDPLLAPLAEDAHLASTKVEACEVRRRELADPEAGRVRGLDDGAVAERDRDPDVGRTRGLVGDTPVSGGQQALDFVDLEHPREAARQARRRDRAPRIAGRHFLARREAVERADRGEALRGRRARAPHPEDREVRPEVAAGGRSPIDAALSQPSEIRPERRRVRALRVGGRVARGQRAEVALEGRVRGWIGHDHRMPSGAGSCPARSVMRRASSLLAASCAARRPGSGRSVRRSLAIGHPSRDPDPRHVHRGPAVRAPRGWTVHPRAAARRAPRPPATPRRRRRPGRCQSRPSAPPGRRPRRGSHRPARSSWCSRTSDSCGSRRTSYPSGRP